MDRGHRPATPLARRRGSMQNSDAFSPTESRELKCPKCKEHYKKPKKLPCGHSMCLSCIEYLQKKSVENKYFHCPISGCNQLCATPGESLRNDRLLEEKIKQLNVGSLGRRSSMTSVARCQIADCDSIDIGCDRCPHCQLRLCRDHFAEDSALVRASCDSRIAKMNELANIVQTKLDQLELEAKNAENMIQENRDTLEHLKACLESQFRQRHNVLYKIKKDLEKNEISVREFHESIREMASAIEEAMKVDEDDCESLQEKLDLTSNADRLARSIKLPKNPDDVRLSETPSDVQFIEEKIGELKVLQCSLEVQTMDDRKLTIPCPVKDSKPHHAVLWSPTEEFCVNSREEIVRKTDETQNKLPKEVLLVTNRFRLVALTLDGKRLGLIAAKTSSPFLINWFDVSSDGKTLVLLSSGERKVLVCDMDGTIRATLVKEDFANERSSFCPGAISMCKKWLAIVDSGNTSFNKPGLVWLLEGPQFDPGQARCIPLATNKRKIFPVGVTHVRRNFFVLATKMGLENESTANEILMHSDQDCEHVADILPDGLDSALQLCSDASGRIFVSVSRSGRMSKVVVLDPLGRHVGSISDPGMASCHGISRSELRDRPSRLVVCDPTNNLVHIFQLA